ncbi:MAG: GAF domain-containing protein [Anaerolineae bacterium]|nr:GAF domain-containing protein [Anaerolineae bacterium]
MTQHMATLPFDISDLLLNTVQRIREAIPFDSGGLALFDPDTQVLLPHVYVGDSSLVIKRVSLGKGIVGQAAERKQPEMILDMRDDPRSEFIDPDSRAELVVPIVFGGELLGVYNLESHQPNAFTSEHLAILQTMADQTALVLYTIQLYRELALDHSQLTESVQVQLRETAALQRLARITSATLNLDEMLINAVRETSDLLNCEGAQLLLPDHVTYQLGVHEQSLFGLAQTWPRTPQPLDGPGYLVDVYHTGEYFYSPTPPPESGPHCQNVLACPLNTRKRTLGVLHLINQQSEEFTTDQITIVQTIANQIAVGLSSAQMFAAERRRADMLNQINRISQNLYAILETKSLFDRAAHSIYDMLGHEAVHVMRVTEDRQRVEICASAARSPKLLPPEDYSFPIDEGVVGRGIRENQTQVVPDVRYDPDYVSLEEQHSLQSCITVMLRRGEQIIGAIDVLSTQLNAFTDLERIALETLAAQLSTALENARLYAQTQQRLHEQIIVYEIGQDLTALLNYTELTHAMVRHLGQALNTSTCMVGLYETNLNAVRIEAHYHAPNNGGNRRSQADRALLLLDEHMAVATAIQNRQPITVYVHDPNVDASARQLLENINAHSQLVLPMIAGNRVLGVVTWIDHEPGRIFTDGSIRLAQTLVAQASVAIDNALLFKQLEQRAVELSEANRLKSQFLATISHELRTPLNSIIGFSDGLMAEIYGKLNEEQGNRIERIARNGRNLLSLIDDLLDLSKIDAGRMELQFEAVDVYESIIAVVQTMESQAGERGLAMLINVPADLPRVYADPNRLRQIITNLLSNAIKFTAQGSITIKSSLIEQDGARLILTSVIDTGIGISPENQTIIFDEFRQADGSTTRAYGGTGLGLAITKKLVETMSGAIWVESQIGIGSEFTFILPVASPDRITSLDTP